MANGQVSSNRNALVAYGTETGSAYDYAEEIGRLLQRIHFLTRVDKLDAIDPASLSDYTFVLVVVSTTGQGDLPINARSFFKSLLRKKLPSTYFGGIPFSVFGLGDSSYPQFNWAARKIHKRFLQLGANQLYPRGEADEQNDEGLDAAFVPWSVDLRKHLLDKFPLTGGINPIPENILLEPQWRLSVKNYTTHGSGISMNGVLLGSSSINGISHPSADSTAEPSISTSQVVSQDMTVLLEQNRRLTPENHWQDVRHLTFNSSSTASYQPGDILTIHPKNSPEDVDQILNQMEWTDICDQAITFTPNLPQEKDTSRGPPPISLDNPSTTLRKLLTDYLDLTAIPRRSFFSLVAHFTNDQYHKDRLLEFTKPEYLDELYDYTTRPKRSILEVLQEFDSVKIPWFWAASILPQLRGRQFSIASGGELKKNPDGTARFELLVAIVKYKTVMKKIRQGVCTRYLAGLTPRTELNVQLQKGSLAVKQADASRPVIMIGPGTGIAPIRSLLWERKQWLTAPTITNQHYASPPLGESLLFFGCRNADSDYFYQDEWKSLQEHLPLQVHAAFSRDQRHKVYVQDLIRAQSESVYRLLQQDCLVYVCGSSGKMPQAVRIALMDVLMMNGFEQSAAQAYLERMEKDGRYKQETW